VLSALDILQPPHLDFFQEIYVITELLQSDLHKIIVSHQPLSPDHIKVFLYQILRVSIDLSNIFLVAKPHLTV
ncbi:hypothetical protein HHI36_008258, partial [Cryptolaemus montrouzieri]